MDFAIYALQASRSAKVYPEVNMNINHAALGIAGEAGELVDAVKKAVIYNKPLDVENIEEELGDLLWYVALMANSLNLSLADVAAKNIDKLRKRYPEKYSDEYASARLDKQ